MSDDHPNPAKPVAWISRLKNGISSIWRDMTRPACADFIGIPHDDTKDRDQQSDRRATRGEQMEIAEYYQWRHF